MAKRRDNAYLKRCRECNKKPVIHALLTREYSYMCKSCTKAIVPRPTRNEARSAWNDMNRKVTAK